MVESFVLILKNRIKLHGVADTIWLDVFSIDPDTQPDYPAHPPTDVETKYKCVKIQTTQYTL